MGVQFQVGFAEKDLKEERGAARVSGGSVQVERPARAKALKQGLSGELQWKPTRLSRGSKGKEVGLGQGVCAALRPEETYALVSEGGGARRKFSAEG